LGHLSRCRTIAHSLVARRKGLSVLILSGSPIIGSFEFRTRVDFVRVPGVIKLRNGEYSSLSLHMDIREVMDLRASIIQHTARAFRPDVFIVDKEPLGLRGEIADTLRMLSASGTRLVLGLRDVMDDPGLLAAEWNLKNPIPALRDLYDEIWVYGLSQLYRPLAGIDLPSSVASKIRYTGYLRRTLPKLRGEHRAIGIFNEPYILVTTGGGGDGTDLIHWVLRAYETDRNIPFPAVLLLGPFMPARFREAFHARAARLDNVMATTFDTHVEALMERAVGVVAMGGYNTFCEVLSFDKRALLLPRREPRLEQLVRATRAAEIGLVRVLDEAQAGDPRRMARALRRLPEQPQPSRAMIPGLLDGLETIHARLAGRLGRPSVELPALTGKVS